MFGGYFACLRIKHFVILFLCGSTFILLSEPALGNSKTLGRAFAKSVAVGTGPLQPVDRKGDAYSAFATAVGTGCVLGHPPQAYLKLFDIYSA